LRPDFDQPLPGVTPANITRPVLLSLHYRPQPLSIALTHLMTESWRDRGWWMPWQRVALGSYEPVVMSGEDELRQTASDFREETIARHIRAWIEQAEARGPSA
jgi:hypothetical protein